MDTSALEQVVTDWTTRPLVDVKVSSKPCWGSEIVTVFSRNWEGTEKGCLLDNGDIQTIDEFKDDMRTERVSRRECRSPIGAAKPFE